MADFVIRGEVIAESRQVSNAFRDVREEVNGIARTFGTASARMLSQSDNLVDEMEGYQRVLRDTRHEAARANQERLDQLRRQTEAQKRLALAASERKFTRRTSGAIADLERERQAVLRLQEAYNTQNRQFLEAQRRHQAAVERTVTADNKMIDATKRLDTANENLANAQRLVADQAKGVFNATQITAAGYRKVQTEAEKAAAAMALARAEATAASRALPGFQRNLGIQRGRNDVAGTELAAGQATLANQQRITESVISNERAAQARRNQIIKDGAAYRIVQEKRAGQAALDEIDGVRHRLRDAEVDHRRFAEQARRSISDVATGWSSLGSALRNFGGLVRSAGTSMSVAFTLPTVLIGRMGFAFNNTKDQAQVAFAEMYRGAGFVADAAQRSNAALERLFQLARTSPFEFESVVKSAQGLVLAGQTDINGLIRMMTAIGNAASAGGGDADKMASKIERLTSVFQKIGLQGRLMRTDLNQLNKIIPAQTYLLEAWRKEVGDDTVTAKEFRDQIRKGNVESGFAIEALLSGVEANFGGLMEELRNTFPGALAELKDTVAIFAGDFFKPIQDELTKLFRFTSNKLEEWRAMWNELTPTTKKVIADIVIAVALLGPALIGVSAVINTIGGALSFVGGTIRGFAGLFGPLLQVTGGWLNLIRLVFQSFIANAGPIAIAIGAIMVAFTLVRDNIGLLQKAWYHLTTDFEGWLNGSGKGLVEGFGAAWAALGEGINYIWSSIVSVGQTAIDGIAQFFYENWDGIKSALSSLAEVAYFVFGVIKTLFTSDLFSIFEGFKIITVQAFELVKLIVRSALDLIAGGLGIIINLLQGDIPGAANALGKMVGRLARNIYDWGAQLFSGLYDLMDRFLKAFNQFVKDALAWLSGATELSIRGIWNGIVEFFKNIGQWAFDTMVSAGKSAKAGFWEGWSTGGEDRTPGESIFPEFQVPDLGNILNQTRFQGGENIFDTGEMDSAAETAKKKTDTVANFIVDLKQKVEELRSEFQLTGPDIESMTTNFVGVAEGTISFAEGVGSATDRIKAMEKAVEGGSFALQWQKITEKAATATEKFLAKNAKNEFLTDARREQIASLTQQKIFYERSKLLKKSVEFERQADDDILKMEIETQKFSVGAYDASLLEKMRLLQRFTAKANATTANAEKYITKYQETLDKRAIAEHERRYKDALEELEGLRIENIEYEEVRERESLTRRLAEYKRKTIDAYGDTKEAKDLILKQAAIEEDAYNRKRLEAAREIALQIRDFETEMLFDPVQKRNAQLRNTWQDAFTAAWKRTGDAIYAAAYAQMIYNQEVAKLKKDIRDQTASAFDSENPFMSFLAKSSTGQGLGALIPQDLVDRLYNMGESVQSLGDKFGFVANNAWALRNQIEAMEAFASGNIFGGMINSLQALSFSMLTNAQVWVSLGQAIGRALSGASGEMENFGRLMLSSVLTTMGQIAIQMGTSMIAIGSLLTSTILFAAQGAAMVTNGIIMVALGVGLVAAGAALAPQGGQAAAAGTASAAASSGGAGGSGGRERRVPRRQFDTSGEVTVNVTFGADKNNKVAKFMLGMLEKEGAITVQSAKGRHRSALKRAVNGRR